MSFTTSVVSVDSFSLGLPDDAIKQGQTVTVSYAVPASGARIRDVAGNEAEGFTDFEVDNNSTADGTPPAPASAEVPARGNAVTLTFNEALDTGPDKAPAASAFTVKADGAVVAVQTVSFTTSVVSVDSFSLGLPDDAIKQGQTVTVSYAVPATGARIRDVAGNEAEGFTDFEVDNNSTVILDGTPPVPASAAVPAKGATCSHAHLQRGPRYRAGQGPRGQRLHRQGRRRRGGGANREFHHFRRLCRQFLPGSAG